MANLEHIKLLAKGLAAWNEWREGSHEVLAELIVPDLSNANLAARDLRGAILFDANLHGSNLKGADFTGALLNQANLSSADVSGVQFDGARLYGTNLTGAYVANAHFDGAYFGGTILSNLDLSAAEGLETVNHRGMSWIGIDTLYKSRGNIPEPFLRGCGVPEELIRYLPSLCNQPIQFYSCFISYSHQDKPFASLLHDRLQGKGIRCWLDEHQLLPGDDLHTGIDRGIRLWDKVLLCASKSSLSSWWVDGEINRAFQKEAQLMKERGQKVLTLIPLNLDGFLLGADYRSGKKAELMSRVAANFVGWDEDHALFDHELERVIRALRTDDAGREKAPPPKL